MRLVLDTNVLIAAYISRGHCDELVEHAARDHDLFTSEYILIEFRQKLVTKFKIPESLAEAAVDLLSGRMLTVQPEMPSHPVSRDPDDDVVLGTAIAAKADCLITGDTDLLVLREHGGIPILPPAAFWEFEANFRPAPETGS